MTQESKKNSISSPPPSSFSFNRIEDCIRWVRLLLILMVVIIAVLPASIFFYIDISENQDRAQLHARHIASLVNTYLEQQGSSLTSLSPQLWAMMKNDKVLFLQLLGVGGEEILRLGEPKRQVFTLTAEIQILPSMHRIDSIVIQFDAHALLFEAGRVFGIHLFVASMLSLVVYVIPMRALRQAVADVKAAHAQILHSDKLSAIGEVYASLTHEINNPLSILLSRVKLLIDSAQEQQFSSDLIHDLEVIERHGNRIAAIIRGLLTFARKTPFAFVKTDLNQITREAIALVEKPFAKEGIRIETALAPDPLAFSGSPNHLHQVFLNLLNNARDAMPQGGWITIRSSKTKTLLVAEIQDNGMGMTPEIHDKIFDPFFTTKKVGKGTGLGLSVSYGIIRDHAGEIEVESTPGEGTIFRMTFPREEVRL